MSCDIDIDIENVDIDILELGVTPVVVHSGAGQFDNKYFKKHLSF